MIKGSCLCGAVAFTVKQPHNRVTARHCGQCRKQSGHYWCSGSALKDNFEIVGDVRWFEASSTAKRGFCPICGSFLFWQKHSEDFMSFSMGAIDGPTNLNMRQHIFTADKGDYYEIADGVPQREN